MVTAMYWLFSFKRIMKNVLLLWRIIYPFAIDHLLYASFIMYKKAVLRKPEGVMFAYLYGDTYTTLSSRYQLHTTPAFKWFAINADPSKPEEAGLGGTVDSIIDYVEEQLANQKEEDEEL